ncbi:MAG: DUF5906 domain-containing protein [Ignavibacteriales bacterium]|nr:DUF5906 domain-containing protein [Ignavibacteriales bacterium]
MNFQTNLEKSSNTSTESIFKILKEKVTIKEVANQLQLDFEESGNVLKGSCPSGHPSASGTSFVMNTDTNLCHCFNCEAGGSVIDLVMLTLNYEIKESVKWIVEKFKLHNEIDLSSLKNFTIPTEKKETEINRRIAHQLLEEVVRWGKEKLYQEEGTEVLNYLTDQRKYGKDKLIETEFFYFPPVAEIKEHLNETFPALHEQIKRLPLKGALGDVVRLAFPYRNRSGMITGIIKRVPDSKGLQKLDKDGSPKKDKNGNDIYERYDSTFKTVKEDLFGLNKIKKAETLLIVEGYPDAIILPALEYNNVVALGQGLFSKRHIAGLVSKKVKNVILALDNDKVGPKNTLRAIDIILSSTNINVFVLEHTKLGSHKDPDEYVRAKGVDDFSKLVLEAEEGELWKLKQICKPEVIKTAIGRSAAYEQALSFALLIKNEITRADYFSEMCKTFSKHKTDILADYRKVKANGLVQRYKKEKEGFGERLTNKYLPFIERATNAYAYYNRNEDEVYLGVGKEILEQIMISSGQRMPEIFPVLKAVYNPFLDRKFDFENEHFNLFTPSRYLMFEKNKEIIELSSSCPSISKLLANLIPRPDECERFINWLAGILQTREKQFTAWVFKGPQGAGKNVLRERILQPLFGKRQVIQVEDQMLESEFNGYLKNVMMIAFNEVANKDNSSRNSVKSKIKAIITDSEIWINEKQIRPFPIENFVNCIFFSNEGVPVLIEDGDRRFNVVNTGIPLREFSWFNADPEAFLNSLSVEIPAFAQYLMNYEYDPIKAKTVFMNNEKSALIKIGMNRFQEFAKYLKDGDVDWLNESQEFSLVNPRINVLHIDVQGKILKDTALKLFNNIYPKNPETKTSLTVKLEIYGIKAVRLNDMLGNRQQYYQW